jgi:hypothetical protein
VVPLNVQVPKVRDSRGRVYMAFAYAGSGEISVTMAVLPCIVRSHLGYDAVDNAVGAVGDSFMVPKIIRAIRAMRLLLDCCVRFDQTR